SVARPTTAAAAERCIAVVLPSVQGVEGSATEVGASVRDLFTSYLTGPSVRTVALEARLVSQALEEARQKACEHILVVTLTRKHSGGGLGKALGQAAGAASWYVPGGSTVGSAIARSAAIGGAQAVATMAASTRAKDEIRIDYSISSLDDAARAVPKTDRAKAQADR